MKLLIIDDEYIVREGLKKIIDWNSYGFTICGEASNGMEGIEKIMTLNPDLVMLDIKIPVIHGTEVAQEVRNRGYKGKFIILSAYSDFEYAKSAIKFGVMAYLLKPLDKTELIEAVLRAKDELEEESIISVYTNQKLKKIKHSFLCDIITGKIDQVSTDFYVYDIHFKADAYQLVLIDFDTYLADIDVLEKYQSSYHFLSADFVLIEGKIVILLKGRESISCFFSVVVHNKLDLPFTPIYIFSSVIFDYGEIPKLYSQIKRTLDKKFFYLQKDSTIYCDKIQIEKEKSTGYSFDIYKDIENIYNYIISGDINKIDEFLSKIENYFRYNEMSTEKTIRILINYYIQTIKAVKNAHPQLNDELSDDAHTINQICEKTTLHEIIRLLYAQYCDIVFLVNINIGSSTIQRIKKYIDINYTKTIKLEMIADIFNYNSAYLGKLFKKETGESFNTYLDKIRIEKSKELLLLGTKIHDAATKCGFNDMNYFSKKFKKYVGCAPASYKLLNRTQEKSE